MKKIIFALLAVFAFASVSFAVDLPEEGSTLNYKCTIPLWLTGTAGNGKYSCYYDKDKKSMVIRVKTPSFSLYLYNSSSPQLYAAVKEAIQLHCSSYSGGAWNSGFRSFYGQIAFYYTDTDKFIRGFEFYDFKN